MAADTRGERICLGLRRRSDGTSHLTPEHLGDRRSLPPARHATGPRHPEPFKRGFSEFTGFYGMLLDAVEYRYVNGFAYSSPRPVSDEEVPRRFQRAEEVWEKKLWRDQVRDWDENVGQVDADPSRAAVGRPRRALRRRTRPIPDAVATGTPRWSTSTCASPARRCSRPVICSRMRGMGLRRAACRAARDASGSAPVSAGASMELGQLIAAMSEDSAGRELLESDREPQQVLEELRSLDSAVGRAPPPTSARRWRLLDGFDIGGRCAIELPDVLLRSIRATVDQGLEPLDVGERIAEVRQPGPRAASGPVRRAFRRSTADIRIRDERGVFSDIWASGIMRRAAVAGGRRLAAQGRIHVAEHFVDAGFEEMCSLLSGGVGLRPTSLRSGTGGGTRTPPRTHLRCSARRRLAARPIRAAAGAGRVMRAIGVGIESLFASSDAARGQPAARTRRERWCLRGPARRVSGRMSSTGSSRATCS